MTEYVSIKNWALEDRPREKMMAQGEEALTEAELLAILIGSGSAEKSAVKLMEEVLARCDGHLSQLSKMTVGELMEFKGIGEAKAITIKAAAEIGRRRAKEDISNLTQIRTAQDVYEIMHLQMRDLNHEEFWALLLNNQAKILRKVKMSTGGITQTAVDVRQIMKAAVLADATSLVVCHNHPGGTLTPSIDDRSLTTRIKQASETMNIKLIDHVIITDGNYYSFAENGKI